MTDHPDPLEGLPDDLARVLRDQPIVVPQDAAVWNLLAAWSNGPSDTASADVDWEQAWRCAIERMLDALAERQQAIDERNASAEIAKIGLEINAELKVKFKQAIDALRALDNIAARAREFRDVAEMNDAQELIRDALVSLGEIE